MVVNFLQAVLAAYLHDAMSRDPVRGGLASLHSISLSVRFKFCVLFNVVLYMLLYVVL